MENTPKTIYSFSLFFLCALVIIIFTSFLGTGVLWDIKTAFGYGGGGGYSPPPPPVNNNTNQTQDQDTTTLTINEYSSSTTSSYIILSGTKNSTDSIAINASSDSITYPSENSWQALRFLDMGANTFTVQTQDDLGNLGEPISVAINRGKAGDVCGGDNIIDDIDLACLAANWGQNWNEGDLMADGIIDDLDLAILVSRWGV